MNILFDSFVDSLIDFELKIVALLTMIFLRRFFKLIDFIVLK